MPEARARSPAMRCSMRSHHVGQSRKATKVEYPSNCANSMEAAMRKVMVAAPFVRTSMQRQGPLPEALVAIQTP